MKIENDTLILEAVLERNINAILGHSRTKDKVAFMRLIILEIKNELPELSQALDNLQAETSTDYKEAVTPELLVRATNIHRTVRIIYDCFLKNDQATLKLYFKNLELKQQ